MSSYTSVTDADRAAMLEAIGVGSIDEIFNRQIPADVRLGRALDLPAGLPEQDVYAHLRDLAAKNTSAEDEITFLGAGMYDHYVPAVIDMLLGRSEYLTPYTPYQPEVSQGNLQVMFEYQTAICELTGLHVSNASVYEGVTRGRRRGYLAQLANKRGTFVVSRGLHPHSRATLETYAKGYRRRDRRGPLVDGVTDREAFGPPAIGDDTSAAIFAQPNFLGGIEDAGAGRRGQTGRRRSARRRAQYDPIPLGILEVAG